VHEPTWGGGAQGANLKFMKKKREEEREAKGENRQFMHPVKYDFAGDQ